MKMYKVVQLKSSGQRMERNGLRGVKYMITSSEVPKYIFAKVRYTETDEMAGKSAWKETRARVTVIKHKKLSVKVEGTRR
jgi:uncharacterized membrane protein YfhO